MKIKKQIFEFIKNFTKSAIAISAILLLTFLFLILVTLGIISNWLMGSDSQNNSINYQNKEIITMDSMEGARSSKIVSPLIPQFYNQASEYDEAIERKIIKNGNLSLIVESIETSKNDIEKITEEFKGFIQVSQFSKNEEPVFYNENGNQKSSLIKSGYFDLKIPAENFKEAFEKFKTIAVEIENESISSSDITEEYSDLETQIKNKQIEEDQFASILKRSGNITEVLEATKYLNNARKEKERLQGRLNYLSNQVELSSIRINLKSEKEVDISEVEWSLTYKIKSGFKNLLEDVSSLINFIILFLFKLPILLFWTIFIFLGFKSSKFIFDKIKNKI